MVGTITKCVMGPWRFLAWFRVFPPNKLCVDSIGHHLEGHSTDIGVQLLVAGFQGLKVLTTIYRQ